MKSHRRKVFILLGIGLLVSALLAVGMRFLSRWLTERVGSPNGELPAAIEAGRKPVFGDFYGHTQASIIERFGLPSLRWEGHYGMPPLSYSERYPDAVTMTYRRPTGTLYLSFCLEKGEWVCFSSAWMPTGCVF
jgi:hypothetical protein